MGPEQPIEPGAALALVQTAWRHIGAHDFASFLDLLGDDIIWTIPDMPDVPFSGAWRGRDRVREFFAVVAESQETVMFKPDRFIAEGNMVVVLGGFVNRVKATGREARSDWVQLWTVDGDRIVGMREFVDTLAVNAAYADAAGMTGRSTTPPD